MKNISKKLFIGALCAILTVTNFNINSIKAKAAEFTPTIAFDGTVTGSVYARCPGTYVAYQIDNARTARDVYEAHKDEDGFRHWRENEEYRDTKFGTRLYHSSCSWTSRSDEFDDGWAGSAVDNYWLIKYKCNICNRTSETQADAASTYNGCVGRWSTNGHHKWGPSVDGRSVCGLCGATYQSYTGRCTHNTTQTRTVKLLTTANYISSEGNSAQKTLTGSNNDMIIVSYGSNANLYVENQYDFETGSIIGYKTIINGIEQNLVGTTDVTSFNNFKCKYTGSITDYTTVQFHIWTQFGNYYTPTVVLVPGSVFTYVSDYDTENIYGDKYTTFGTNTMEKTIVLPNSKVVLQDCKFTRKGYYFVGWSLNPNMKIKDISSSAVDAEQVKDCKIISAAKDYNAKNILKGDISEMTNGTGAWRGGYTHTLYAIWAPIRYNVDYDKGLTDVNGTMPTQRYRYDEDVTLHKHTYTGRNYKITYDNNLPLTYAGVPTASVPHYTLSTENKDGTAPVIKSNLTFKDWNVTSSYNGGHYKENTNLGPADFEFTDEARSLATAWWNDYSPELPHMYLPGYQWNGWYADAKGTTINTDQVESYSEGYTSSPSVADTNLKGSLKHFTLKQALVPFATTFYSKWTPNTYYVIYVDYDGNGNTKDINRLSSHNKVQTCTYDQLYHYEPDRPSNDEKIFLGWSTVDPDTYTWTKENIEDEPIWVQADGEFTNLTTTQHGVIYRWAVWVKIGEPVNPGSPENPPSDKVKLINTDQIQINGTNVYKDPTRDKTYYIQDNTLFDLNFNGISQIDKEYLRKYFMSTQNAFNDSHKNLSQLTKIDLPIEQKVDVTGDATLTNAGSLINVEDFTATRTTDYVKLNYKQNYMLDADKDNMLINIYPTSQVTFINPFRKVVAFTGKSNIELDKTHNLQIICDSTPTTIMIPEEYDVDENGYVPIIEEDVTIPIKYADFVKNVDPSNPEYGSGVNTKNITVTLTQEQTDDGGAPYIQVFKDDTLSEIIKIKESSLYTGEIDLTFSPSKFSDISGFITIKIDITDNVGITVSKEYRFLVMRLETSLKNTVEASMYHNTASFAPGENGQILIESNGFIDKASIAFPYTLDSLAAEEKSNAGDAESGYWHVGRTLSDTYPRDKDGNIVTVLPQMQTKLWGTTHLGGMQWNGSDYEHSYLTHFFYAPLYTEKGKYPVLVTIYKTDAKNPDKTYTITKTLYVYIGMVEDDSTLPEPGPITTEFRDEIVDN